MPVFYRRDTVVQMGLTTQSTQGPEAELVAGPWLQVAHHVPSQEYSHIPTQGHTGQQWESLAFYCPKPTL